MQHIHLIKAGEPVPVTRFRGIWLGFFGGCSYHALMLGLIHANTMAPPIVPVGLEYTTQAAILAGASVDILDLCLMKDRPKALSDFASTHGPGLIGIAFRRVADAF